MYNDNPAGYPTDNPIRNRESDRPQQNQCAQASTGGGTYCAAPAESYREVELLQREQAVRHCFAHHPPRPDQVARYTLLRDDFTALAVRTLKNTSPGPAQDAALEALHVALMLTNRAIALGGHFGA